MNTGKVILTVSNVNQYIKSLLTYDPNLTAVSVRGEISNFKRYASGHAYFSLKDATGVLKCVMFQSYFSKIDFQPVDGMSVVASGSINVYERDGVYQLYVQTMCQDGIGSLYERFEALKKKLNEEGLFDASHKRPIPLLPRAVAVVTSPSGAVIEDIRNVSQRRFPGIPILLYPASVQGAGSCEEIVSAIERANQDESADVLIVGRGGGSIEDLWSFNDESVARAVFASKLPVISAVGHETDYTICDFVADLRAPTPSAAAELAVPQENKLRTELHELTRKIQTFPKHNIELKQAHLDRLAANRHFTSPYDIIQRREEDLMHYEERLIRARTSSFERMQRKLENCELRLKLLNPTQVLERGYAIIKDDQGKVILNGKELEQRNQADIMMRDKTVRITFNTVRQEGEC